MWSDGTILVLEKVNGFYKGNSAMKTSIALLVLLVLTSLYISHQRENRERAEEQRLEQQRDSVISHYCKPNDTYKIRRLVALLIQLREQPIVPGDRDQRGYIDILLLANHDEEWVEHLDRIGIR
jgi:hypothetical protein